MGKLHEDTLLCSQCLEQCLPRVSLHCLLNESDPEMFFYLENALTLKIPCQPWVDGDRAPALCVAVSTEECWSDLDLAKKMWCSMTHLFGAALAQVQPSLQGACSPG